MEGIGVGVARATATGKKSQMVFIPIDMPAVALLLSTCDEPSAARPKRIAVEVVEVVVRTYLIVAAVALLAAAAPSLKKGPSGLAPNSTAEMLTPDCSNPWLLTMLLARWPAASIPVVPEFNSRAADRAAASAAFCNSARIM